MVYGIKITNFSDRRGWSSSQFGLNSNVQSYQIFTSFSFMRTLKSHQRSRERISLEFCRRPWLHINHPNHLANTSSTTWIRQGLDPCLTEIQMIAPIRWKLNALEIKWCRHPTGNNYVPQEIPWRASDEIKA